MVIGVDLGTSTGICFRHANRVSVGVLKLASSKEIRQWQQSRATRFGDPRIFRLLDWLKSKICIGGETQEAHVVFEDVLFSGNSIASQLWASLRTVLWLLPQTVPCPVKVFPVPVQTLKMFATGSGSAEKSDMIASAKKLCGLSLGHDAADAFHLWRWGEQMLNRHSDGDLANFTYEQFKSVLS